jgi:hypothetical protein
VKLPLKCISIADLNNYHTVMLFLQFGVYAECHYAVCRKADCRGAKPEPTQVAPLFKGTLVLFHPFMPKLD